jgi:hypothetical protein
MIHLFYFATSCLCAEDQIRNSPLQLTDNSGIINKFSLH